MVGCSCFVCLFARSISMPRIGDFLDIKSQTCVAFVSKAQTIF